MEQLPQRGSVPQIGVFHTPGLWNVRVPSLGYEQPTICHRADVREGASPEIESGLSDNISVFHLDDE